jgi:hypothetical protein
VDISLKDFAAAGFDLTGPLGRDDAITVAQQKAA